MEAVLAVEVLGPVDRQFLLNCNGLYQRELATKAARVAIINAR